MPKIQNLKFYNSINRFDRGASLKFGVCLQKNILLPDVSIQRTLKLVKIKAWNDTITFKQVW